MKANLTKEERETHPNLIRQMDNQPRGAADEILADHNIRSIMELRVLLMMHGMVFDR